MLKLDADEMRRILRLNFTRDEQPITELMRTTMELDLQQWPQDKLLEHTRRGLDRAIAHNLSTQRDVMRFLVMRHQYGERFDEFPAVRKFLQRKDLPVDDRIEMMMLTLPMLIWDVVKRRTPPGPSAPVRFGAAA